MKRSNIIKLMLSALALVPCMNACQEMKMDIQEAKPLCVKCDALESYDVSATAPANIVFNISSNTPWEIHTDAQWLTISPKMSASSSLVSEVVVSIEDNPEKEGRNAVLTIHGEGLESVQKITVNQASKEKLVVVPSTEIVPARGGKISFTILSNKDWEIIPSADFVSQLSKKNGTGSEKEETIELTIPQNNAAQRVGTLTVKTAFEEKSFEITQDGYIFEYTEDPEMTEYVFQYGYIGEKVLKVASNFEWKVELDKKSQEWLTAEKIDEETLKLVAKSYNPIFIDRVAEVKIKPAKLVSGYEGETLTVKQSVAFWYNGEKADRTIDETTGKITIKTANGHQVTTNYPIKKGSLTYMFEEFNMTNGDVVFNMWPNAGNTNFNLMLKSDGVGTLTCGGGFEWQQLSDNLTIPISEIKSISFVVDDKPGEEGHLRITAYINGNLFLRLENAINDVYKTPDPQNPGQLAYIQPHKGAATDHLTITKVIYQPTK